MKPKVIFNLSGIYGEPINDLPTSKESKFLGLQDVSNVFKTVPTYQETCPVCNNGVIWRTTGMILSYITCKKCGTKFKIR